MNDGRLRLALLQARIQAGERIATEMRDEAAARAALRKQSGAGRIACECGLVTLPGPMSRHQKATGHKDLI